MRPVLGLVPLFIPVSAFTTGPVSTALVSGRPGGLLDDGVRPVAGNLFTHAGDGRRVIIHTPRPDKHPPDPGNTFSFTSIKTRAQIMYHASRSMRFMYCPEFC